MPRTDLSALLQKIDTEDVEPLQRPTEPPARPETATPAAKVEAPASSPETESATPRKRQSTRVKKAPTVDTPASPSATSEPLYLRLVRKARAFHHAARQGAIQRRQRQRLVLENLD